MDGHAMETTLLTSVQIRGKLEPSSTPKLIAGMIQRAGKCAPRMTSQSVLRLMADYFVPASKPQSSNPTLRPAPPGPDPTNSPEVQKDFPKPSRGESPPAPPLDLLQLQQLFPWTASLPERLQQGLLWDPSVSPYEVQTPAQLLLYTGKADSQSLDSVLLSRQSQLKGHIIALDIKRSEDQDILRGDLYSQLCVSAWNGNIQATGEARIVGPGAYFVGFQNQASPNQSEVGENPIAGASQSWRSRRLKTQIRTACSY